MILGANNGNNQNNMNNNNFTSNFNERLSAVQENNKKTFGSTNMGETTRNMKYTDVNSSNDMQDKAFAMLQDRLRNGTISLEEFNRKCSALGKLRNK